MRQNQYTYGDRRVLFSFLIDYSMSPDGKMVVYEVQNAMSSNFENALNREKNANRGPMYQAWGEWIKKKYGSEFTIDLASELIDDKAQQRTLLEKSPYQPQFMILDRSSMKSASTIKEEIQSFFREKGVTKIVIKGTGAKGVNNIFLDINNPDIEQKIKLLLDEGKGRYFVIESQIMYSPLPEDAARFSGYQALGAYYRDLVVFDPTNQTVEFIEVYRNILDTTFSTDSHRTDRSNLEETAFLLEHMPAEQEKETKERERRNPAYYKAKKAIFAEIAKPLFDFTLSEKHSPSEIPSSYFFDWFHRSDEQWEYFQYLSQIQRGDWLSPTGNDAFDLKLCNKRKEIDFLKNTDRQDFMVRLYELIPYMGKTELLFLYVAIQRAKTEPNAPFHSLWSHAGFFKRNHQQPGDQALMEIDSALMTKKRSSQ